MRFCLDEDLSPRIADIARNLGLDVLSSHEVGRNGLSDDEQLRLAAEDGRCFVTRNRDDFIALTLTLAQLQQPHAGVLIVSRSLPATDFARIAHALAAYALRHPGGLSHYTVDFLIAA